MEPPLLRPPLSKSDAHRALVLGELCGAPLELPAELPRDVEVLRRGLDALRSPTPRLDCLDAGAPFRFLLTQAALSGHPRVEFTGTPRLAERPHEPLIDALERGLGVRISPKPLAWPLVVEASSARFENPFRVAGSESSQFASSVLLGAARLVHAGRPAVSIVLDGAPTSVGYLELTVHWLTRFGFEVEQRPGQLTVTRFVPPAVFPRSVPGDWSSLTYLLPLAWKFGCAVEGVDRAAHHPDRHFADHLERAGLTVHAGERTSVTGRLERGLTADASVCPDAIPALVAVALACPGPSVFTRCEVLRLKESDRLAALAELVHASGGSASIEAERLTVHPPERPTELVFDGRDDHRLVMAAVVAGALLERPVRVRGTSAVAKSFPGFWREVGKLGLSAQEAA